MVLKKRRIAGLLGFVGLMSTSLILAACSSSYDMNNVSEIKLEMPFVSRGVQANAFEEIAAKFNDFAKLPANKAEGYLPVRAFANNADYGKTRTSIVKNLKVKNYRDLPNLTLNYGSLAMSIAQNGASLDFSKSNTTAGLKDDKVNKAVFNQALLSINDNIQGIAAGGLYVVPAGVSTDLIYVDRPVMYYVLNKMIQGDGITIKSDDENWFKETFGVANKTSTPTVATKSSRSEPQSTTVTAWSATDQDAIAKIWGNYTKPSGSSSYELKKSTFDSYYDLLDFSSKVSAGFKTKSTGVLGFDSLANTVEIMAFNKLGYDYNKFLWHKDSTGNYTYPYLKDTTNEQQTALKEVYEKLETLSKANSGLWLRPNSGTYPSADFQKHQLLFNVGSNSGYSFRIDKTEDTNKKKQVIDSANELVVLAQPSTNASSTNAAVQTTEGGSTAKIKGSYTSQGGSLIGISFNARLDRATKLFVRWLTSDASKEFSLKQVGSETTQIFNGIDYYALKGSYVAPSANFLTGNDSDKYMQNIAAKAAFDQYKARKNAQEYKAYFEPVAIGADPFRSLVESTNVAKKVLTPYDAMLRVLKETPDLINFTK